MSLNGIDISNWQAGLDPAAVPGDFIIVKASEGVDYISPVFKRQADGTLNAGKLLGIYHYVNGSGAVAEAAFFIAQAQPYVGKAVLALDWEKQGNGQWGNVSYLKQVASEVIARTGVRPLIYCSSSLLGSVAPVAQELNCGLWVAQYPNYERTGYQQTPWNEGAYACAIRQYSSAGLLNGYQGNLDLDKFYGDKAAWLKYAAVNGKPAATPAPTQTATKKSIGDIASEVIAGKWSTGTERIRRIEAAGYDYKAVQDEVNRRLNPAPNLDALANAVIAGKYGNGQERRNRLGANYDAVMAIVNKKLGGNRVAPRVYVVKAGDSLSSIGARLGVSWAKLARDNGIANPNVIYPGQRLTY